MLEKIEVIKQFELDELKNRLNKVKLKGFPEVEIYNGANISIEAKTPSEVLEQIFIPQPTIYRKGFLDRIDSLSKMFSEKGIDIFGLRGGIDYIAITNEGKMDWTLIPPVVEVVPINFTKGRLDYSNQISKELKDFMAKINCNINTEINDLSYPEYKDSGIHYLNLVCDGSHRVHAGLERKISQNLLFINSPKRGFPYYAAPKPYSVVHVEEERPEEGGKDKTHILESPAHKALYRLFPTGGILNGTVRPE